MSNLIMERVITNETALADWKVKWGAARTAFSILCFWQIRIFTIHSTRKMCIFTWPKRFAFSLDPKAANFNSAQSCPKTVPLRLAFFHSKPSLQEAGPLSWMLLSSCDISLNSLKQPMSEGLILSINWYDWNMTCGHTFACVWFWLLHNILTF